MCTEEGKVGCGGAIRGDGGEWLKGFSVQLERCGVMEAEAWGVLVGLKLCRDMGFEKIEVESDAKQVVDLLVQNKERCRYIHIFQEIHEMMQGDWQIKINHVFREGNRVADKLAHLSLQIESPRIIWDTPPPEVRSILEEELAGTKFPRRVLSVCNGRVM
ncbi:uncharacterized protein LOC114733180 [Neltuma alba]|uniref:uncharacterized protein LOC114733180 n=1 Tax=Neltuma alba TaxID=207710 RepID=UPI0010A41960|nr:uncharacterized protein LOC114733180 [Prosopis alba]